MGLGPLAPWARDVNDTRDLVQETVFQTFRKIDRFEARGDGALDAYLRQAILNRIHDELRRAKRQPVTRAIDSGIEDDGHSPLKAAIGNQAVARYEKALATLRHDEREAIVVRIELGYTHEELAGLLGKPTANAARMAVERAITRLANAMRDARA